MVLWLLVVLNLLSGIQGLTDAHTLTPGLTDRLGIQSHRIYQTNGTNPLVIDNTLADAILDRPMHNAHRIKLKGESMRKLQSILD